MEALEILGLELLLFLQYLREITGGCFDSFFLFFTDFGLITTILIIISAIYWSLDKKLGEFLILSASAGLLFTSFAKVIACIYRPWILDSNIHPVEAAIPDATGYSFPSGHTMNSVITFGGASLKENITKGLKIALLICLILVAFSRCYLGVHSPADVVCSLIVGFLILFVFKKIFPKIDNDKYDLIIAFIGVVLSIALVIYTITKGYPMDYVGGKLLVDPKKMAVDAYETAGFVIGILLSWIIERRFIKFSCDGPVDCKILRIVGGFIGFEILILIIKPILDSLLPLMFSSVLNYILMGFYVVVIVPTIIKYFQNRKPEIYKN